MTKMELSEKLIEKSIRKDSYYLEGGLPNEAYCLNKNRNIWEVYYSERGIKNGLKVFDNESDACKFLYSLLVKCC